MNKKQSFWKQSNEKTTPAQAITGFILIVIIFMTVKAIFKSDGPSQNQKAESTTQASSPTPEPTKEPITYDIDATIRLNELAFQITNNEDRNWYGCKLELNSEIFKSGYVYEQPTITSKESVIIPFREFTKGDGTRFNSYDVKVKNLSLSCDKVDDKRGWNYFEIN